MCIKMTTPEQRKKDARRRASLWYYGNIKRAKLQRRRYYELNRDKFRIATSAWKKRNPEKVREARRRRSKTPSVRLRQALCRRISLAITKRVFGVNTMKLLGCSLKDFLIYIESRFDVGMTFENYGKVWEVDHIMPCAIFDLAKAEHRKRCFHFSNLQPLFVSDNRIKNSRIITDQFNLL